MAIKEKRVIQEIVMCDSCGNDIEDKASATHVTAKAEGFYKRDSFEIDLCENCGEKMGLKRRGRRPNGVTTTATATASNGTRRAKKVEPKVEEATTPKDDDWED